VNDLIIGLRAKERESKVEGRFFAMMSWNLRLYFVVTEYLIKRDFLGLFPGIMMKDTLNQVQKNILNAFKDNVQTATDDSPTMLITKNGTIIKDMSQQHQFSK
jgi:hypothetical protein